MEIKRLKEALDSQSSTPMMSYCIIRSKLKRARDEDHPRKRTEVVAGSLLPPAPDLQSSGHRFRFTSRSCAPGSTATESGSTRNNHDDSIASSVCQNIAMSSRSNQASSMSSDSFKRSPQLSPSSPTATSCQVNVKNHQKWRPRSQLSSASSSSLLCFKVRPAFIGWNLLLAVLVLCLWSAPSDRRARNNISSSPVVDYYVDSSSFWTPSGIVDWIAAAVSGLMSAGKMGPQLVAAQYKPEWPSKALQHEIFLLNLEDGYFGCQVNESQDFLQLFELSKLCDGQPQCYLGTDEMSAPLKCNNRERCGSYKNSRDETESIQCVNGVCLDGLCYCNDGYGGKSCDVPDDNECKYRPCDVFAHCTNTMGSYYCSCFPGYDGDGIHCQDINECEIPNLAALCSDNSECCNLPGHFVCKCKPGFQQTGQSQSSLTGAPTGNSSVLCTDIDECQDERACGRGASCENLPGSFRCSCPAGFTGDPAVECIDMDECRNNPCGAGAQCTNIPGGYRCSCAPGFERNPTLPADLFGTIQSAGGQAPGEQVNEFTNSTLIACLDVNECAGKAVCGQGAQCINTPGAYFCQCPPNYTGNPKVACTDIDECASHVCGPNAQCKNSPGSYKCECKQGYSGNAYAAEGCQDEDECARKDACGLNAQCFNTLGSYQCSCPTGFTGDAHLKCVDIDECATPYACGPGAQCINVEGSYKCTCPDKFMARGTPEMGCERAAVDIGCSADFDCTQNALCLNSTCQCKLGYQANGIECVDVDECALGQPPPSPIKAFGKLSLAVSSLANSNLSSNPQCGPEATCHNTDGSYRCDCRRGYEKVEPGSGTGRCRDINECDQSNPCGPNSRCFNTDGGFKCACSEGFIVGPGGDPANGCRSPCDGVNCGHHATCKPHGEEAACVCKPGFTFDPNNIKLGCVDINECDTNYGPAGLCGQRAVCTNVPGSYRCHCPAGYSGDAYRYCEDINECDRRFGVFGQCGELAVCNNTAGSYTCTCAPGYTGDPRTKCVDIDECATGRCGEGALCVNTPGKFTCRCPTGYTGDPLKRCVPEQPACSSASDCPANQVCQSGRCQCPYPQLVPGDSECHHPCERTECGSHATCQLDSENQALCVCDSGYMAPSDGRSGCVDVNECIQGLTLSGVTPLSTLTSGRGAVALGPSSTTPGGSNSSHPCGRNALCRNQPGSFDCVCPPGHSGDAYVACTLDVRNQQMGSSPKAPTSTTSGVVGNYQQEPRTTTCSEPCQRGHVCSDGQCVKPDACRDNQDCRTHQACELVNQVLGFQCVEVCELNQCGPEAKCTPMMHKPICSCNSTAGYSGDPYDLVNGCRAPQVDLNTNFQQQTTTATSSTTSSFSSSSGFMSQTSTLAAKHDQVDGDKTTLSNKPDLSSTTAFDLGTSDGPTVSKTTPSSNSTLEQLQRQQLEFFNQNSSKRPPGEPTGDYELPLPTTPILPQFSDSLGYTTTGSQSGSQSPNISEQRQTSSVPYDRTTLVVPYLTTVPDQITDTLSRQQQLQEQRQQQQLLEQKQQQLLQQQQLQEQKQQQQLQQQQLQQQQLQEQKQQQQLQQQQLHQQQLQEQKQQQLQQQQLQEQKQSSVQNLFPKRKPQIQVNSQQSSAANRQDQNDSSQAQQQPHEYEQRQKQQTKEQLQVIKQQHVSNQVDEILQTLSQFSNKSSLLSNGFELTHKRLSCTADQHCPGNLFCLDSVDEQPFRSSQKYCGCPAGYRREADYCFMTRVNCTSSSVCKAREECVAWSVLQQYYVTSSTGGPQSGSQQFGLSGAEELSGICVCPRGYKLTASGVACIDRNECDEGTPCAVGAVCQNKIGSYECVCPPGTSGEPYTKTCEPIPRAPPAQECLANSDCPSDRECDLNSQRCVSPCRVCGPRAICTAANHAAICLCPPRYTGNAIDLVYGCQEPAATPPALTTARPSGSSTAVGVPYTTLLPALNPTTTTVAPPESTTAEMVEFRTIPPSELFVMCLADGIQVEVQLGGFDGIIYVKGHSQDPKCRKLVMSSNANEFVDFKVQFGHCDLIHRDGEAGFVLVIQKHPKLVTYRARAYHVKCVYNTGERTVTLGFNVSMITTSGTIANTGPPPTCLMAITALDGSEVRSAEIGQDLLLRVDVQPDSIYGGFARSCEARTREEGGREIQYEVTDAAGCATDPSIFSDWNYDQERKSLVARFNAFKFPSSNELKFQCNIRVCFGSCPAVNCNGIDAYGKRRRRREAPALLGSGAEPLPDRLDDEPADELVVTDAFKEGALREEIMVQSNAILTIDRKEKSLAQQRTPQVEEIEFVCLPRLGIIMSVVLTTLLALLALAIATSCWCFAKRNRARRARDQQRLTEARALSVTLDKISRQPRKFNPSAPWIIPATMIFVTLFALICLVIKLFMNYLNSKHNKAKKFTLSETNSPQTPTTPDQDSMATTASMKTRNSLRISQRQKRKDKLQPVSLYQMKQKNSPGATSAKGKTNRAAMKALSRAAKAEANRSLSRGSTKQVDDGSDDNQDDDNSPINLSQHSDATDEIQATVNQSGLVYATASSSHVNEPEGPNINQPEVHIVQIRDLDDDKQHPEPIWPQAESEI